MFTVNIQNYSSLFQQNQVPQTSPGAVAPNLAAPKFLAISSPAAVILLCRLSNTLPSGVDSALVVCNGRLAKLSAEYFGAGTPVSCCLIGVFGAALLAPSAFWGGGGGGGGEGFCTPLLLLIGVTGKGRPLGEGTVTKSNLPI